MENHREPAADESEQGTEVKSTSGKEGDLEVETVGVSAPPAPALESATATGKSGWKRLRHSRAFLPLAVGIPVLVALGIYLPWEFSKVALPDLSGLTLPEAEEALAALDSNLGLELNAPPESDLETFWKVSNQNPAPGARVPPNSPVTLSGDLIDVTVPALETLSSLSEVETLLAKHGLTGEVTLAYIDGSTIPGIEGVDDATLDAFLDASGIYGDGSADGTVFPVTVDQAFLSSNMANLVIPSNIAGSKMKAGSTVTLVLVPPITVVPNIVGMSVSDAQETISRAYLTVNFGETEDWFTVQTQAVPSGSPFMIGSEQIAVTASPDTSVFPTLDRGTWAQIIKNPDAHVDTRAVLYGDVVQFDVNTGACALRMQTGPAQTENSFDYKQNTYVQAGGLNCDLLGPIVQDDHLRIWVTVSGSRTYSTSIGGSATALEVDIWAFEALPQQRY